MPFGHDCEYADFDACVRNQVKKGKSRESARRICGRLQADTEEKCRQNKESSAMKTIAIHADHASRDCIADYFGTWLIEPLWFSRALDMYRDGRLPFVHQDDERRAVQDAIGIEQALSTEEDELEDDALLRGPNGMAIIPLRGHLMKSRSSFGGSSTIEARRLLRMAAGDSTVSGIMLFIDSPGGTAAGTFELADEVGRAARAKPLRAHIQDFGASAAYWPATQASRVTANPTGQVGSIGSVALVIDSSEAMKQRGLVVHAIASGEFKAAGAPGTVITERHLEKFQEEVNDINAFFLRGVQVGRGFTDPQLRRVSTGEIWIAQRARDLGIIDGVETWEAAVEAFASTLAQPRDRRMDIGLRERDHLHD